jgi:hypothetical protein
LAFGDFGKGGAKGSIWKSLAVERVKTLLRKNRRKME